MRSASYAHYPPSRSGDRLSDGNDNPRTLGARPPNDSMRPRSILRKPNPLLPPYPIDHSFQQLPRPSRPLSLTSRMDMYPPYQTPSLLSSTYNDSPRSPATPYSRGHVPWIPRGYESKHQQHHHPSHLADYQQSPRDHGDNQKRTSLPPHAFQQQQSGAHDVFASMPDIRRIPRPSSADIERDRQARACGLQLDYTSHHNVPPSSNIHLPRGSRPLEEDQPQREPKTLLDRGKPYAPRPKPHILYPRLDKLVRREKHRAMDHISFDEDVIELYREDGDLREKLREKRKGGAEKRDPKFRVREAPLRDVLIHASSTITINEHQHDVPTLVVACVEELTRTGIYQQGLFRTLPSRDRYMQLIDIFDSSADYGAKFSMRGQTMPDICAVLSTFISSLPHPLLDPKLYGGFWHWCVKPSVKREEVKRSHQDAEEEEKRARGELPLMLPMSPKQQHKQAQDNLHLGHDGEIERHQIMIAQIILRFLPIGHLSLLIYLCGFFTQLPLCPENGIEFEDIARIFGHKIFGATAKVSSQKMMVWLLTRWHNISEGLLTDACGMSRPSTPVLNQKELPDSEQSGGGPMVKTPSSRRSRSSDSDRSSYSSSPQDQVGSSTTRYRKKRSIESTPNSGEDELPRPRRLPRRNRLGRQNSAFISHRRKTSGQELSDVFSKAFANALISPSSSDSKLPERTSGSQPESILLDTRVRLARLQSDLQRNNLVVVDAIKESFKASDEARLLSEKIEQLEKTFGDTKSRNTSTLASTREPLQVGILKAA
ncbi:uncharacterized protein EDB93DRAFT_1245901 [Suillus bovinus]|uniref:uncharacterized protein n=1 Tax=Suillus bovinus TaxID=48563 RepID=UPI001B87A58D|nr:uncharacterized protein EDB93DRAFT_1245901 [Suillus bovinus]KAG2158670.1 hypothetical protein EDB93DRAFT_1245901 [Suillus bovinus]